VGARARARVSAAAPAGCLLLRAASVKTSAGTRAAASITTDSHTASGATARAYFILEQLQDPPCYPDLVTEDRERRIAAEAEQMMRMSRTRERHKVFLAGAAGCFGLAVLSGAVLSPAFFPVFLGLAGVLFILAGRDARRGGYVATPVSLSVSAGGVRLSDDDDTDTRALEDMSGSQQATYAQGAGLKLYVFGGVAIAVALFAGLLISLHTLR
jgi:hypothetical protein